MRKQLLQNCAAYCCALAFLCTQLPDLFAQNKAWEKELEDYFAGYYCNIENVENNKDAGNSALIQTAMSVIQRIELAESKEPWYYYCRFYVHKPEKPVIQLLYRFEEEGTRVVAQHYELSPLAQAMNQELWGNPKSFKKFKVEKDLVRQEACDLQWKKEGNTYIFEQVDSICPLLQGMGDLKYFAVQVLFDEQGFTSTTRYYTKERQRFLAPAQPPYKRYTKRRAKKILWEAKKASAESAR